MDKEILRTIKVREALKGLNLPSLYSPEERKAGPVTLTRERRSRKDERIGHLLFNLTLGCPSFDAHIAEIHRYKQRDQVVGQGDYLSRSTTTAAYHKIRTCRPRGRSGQRPQLPPDRGV